MGIADWTEVVLKRRGRGGGFGGGGKGLGGAHGVVGAASRFWGARHSSYRCGHLWDMVGGADRPEEWWHGLEVCGRICWWAEEERERRW